MAKAVTDIRDFLAKARRKDATKLKIKKNKDGSVKFKIRCTRFLYTLKVDDADKAAKLEQTLPPALPRENL
eukprot:CAMPEP_0116914832 /NCGR_PEP_ID=MMETSP0467-20121206/17561_1 /TAXON_ID=283647 /ORGANISM="Mesodinium pulex, Strain SPMC105" /LENGTH=70 /DNA_ID=CAMNT_0004591367 /DNA_START=71 /DNA_END=283 /DNA_ORIENTATION=+